MWVEMKRLFTIIDNAKEEKNASLHETLVSIPWRVQVYVLNYFTPSFLHSLLSKW